MVTTLVSNYVTNAKQLMYIYHTLVDLNVTLDSHLDSSKTASHLPPLTHCNFQSLLYGQKLVDV